jgi:hypothetical protein
MAGALYGAFLATLMFILTKALPGGPGWMIFFMYSAIHLAVGAAVVWRRTRLHAMTGAFVWGAGASAVFAAMAARGLSFDEVLQHSPVLVLVASLGPPFMFLEWRHPSEWRQLKRAASTCSFFDMLVFRHIPHVRVDSLSSEGVRR